MKEPVSKPTSRSPSDGGRKNDSILTSGCQKKRSPKSAEIIECVSHIAVLAPHPYIIDIAHVYLNNYLMPRTLTGDALHLAYASYYKIDFLLTWNCQHLANANKKQYIRIINTRMNLFTPDIVTPLELFTEPSYDD